ncbi:MAG TPA: hypothetical protein PKH19_05760 [Candidatus Syntrophosphaera sp.]|nr:hypothetical protein [Candidatus Syntrophosphaera sp.]
MDLLIRKFNGYASHTHLLNYSHMRKREFKDTIESLLEREAIVCETGPQQANYKFPKMYKANPDIMRSWDPDQNHKITQNNTASLMPVILDAPSVSSSEKAS